MAQFWLGTRSLDPIATGSGLAAQPLLASDVAALGIEIIRQGEMYAVLLSTLKRGDDPQDLACRIGFSNAEANSTFWRDLGFPLVDASIVHEENGTLSVRSPHFIQDDERMQYGEPLLEISGVEFAEETVKPVTLKTRYQQSQDSPDFLAPARSILRQPVAWEPARSKVKQVVNAQVALTLTPTRYPSLLPFETGTLALTSAWTGEVDAPKWGDLQGAKSPPRRVSRADTFGVPAFHFDDVEAIGFRIDLPRADDEVKEKLERLIAPLNFHLQDKAGGAPSDADFRYVPATATLIVELLRYGKMRLQVPEAPLDLFDYQSQHELLVRVLVGRVDDDTTQARDPAVFVPAIFVDNPWSKVLGREVQGFDKRLAQFCVQQGAKLLPLRPDGRLAKDDSVLSLNAIASVILVENMGATARGQPIVQIDYANPLNLGKDDFEDIDLELAMGGSSLSLTRWQQDDFADPEFRRSFARAAVRRTLKGFRSIQVSPVGIRESTKTWITGTFVVHEPVRIARPRTAVNLTFHAPDALPTGGWAETCDLLEIAPGRSRTLSIAGGNWYQMRFSMDLVIDQGLA